MSENANKPEWFQLADGDAPSAQVRKVNKKLPAMAALVTGVVIASGAFFANASQHDDPSPIVGIESVDNTTNANLGGASQGDAPSGVTSGGAHIGGTPSTPPLTNNNQGGTGIQNPNQGGVAAPQGHGDDDGDGRGFDGDGERGDHRDGDHEGREGHERGERTSAPVIPAPSGTNKNA